MTEVQMGNIIGMMMITSLTTDHGVLGLQMGELMVWIHNITIIQITQIPGWFTAHLI